MTLYWWMHWFWITLWMSQQIFVVSGHSLLTTLYSVPTTNLPARIKNQSQTTTRDTTLSLPKDLNTHTLRNSSLSKNLTITKTALLSKNLDVLPLIVSSSSRNSTTNLTVINQNLTDTNVNLTGIQMLSNGTINSLNQTDNFTYFGEELNYNHSLVQSERIAINEEDLDVENGTGNLSAAGITGITLGCVIVVGIICGVSFFIYHNQGFNRPQVLNDRCSNPDSSGYIDDASVRDNSEEMYSLDNDSFLNSLEAMTIQNYWTDTVKHTKL